MNLEQAMYSLNHLDGPIRISCKQCGCLEVFENAKLQDQIDQFCHLKQIPLQSFTLVLTIDSCPNMPVPDSSQQPLGSVKCFLLTIDQIPN
jgi:hypothetical protein